MQQPIRKKTRLLVGISALLLIIGVTMSFQSTPFGPIDKLDTLTEITDTIPENNKKEEQKMNIKDFDQLLMHLDNESLSMQKDISGMDLEKIQNEITASLDKVDFDKIKKDIDKAMKAIDFKKMEQDVQSALTTIDWNKMNHDAKTSLENVKKQIEKINMAEVKMQMEKAKIEIERSQREITKLNMAEIMKYAHEGIAASKASLRSKKEMFNEMEKNGLINQKEGFTIEFKDKTLIVNGKKQNDSIYQQYRPYIQGDSFKISIGK